MTYYRDDNIWIINADVMEGLGRLEDESVHCVVTSPPYWGLRDYGEDGQIGLEKSPEDYVNRMVEVFREVKRVLRDDGTVWLNLGSSYASSSMQPNLSQDDVPACDNDDKEQSDLQESGHAYYDSDDESRGDSQNHRHHNFHSEKQHQQSSLHSLQKDHDNERLDCAEASLVASPPDARASTILSSGENVRGVSDHEDGTSVYLEEQQTSSADGLQSSCKNPEDDIPSKAPLLYSLDCHNQGKVLSSKAQQTPYGLISNNLTSMFHNVKFKAKDLIPIPWMVAMALQADGWILRCDIIWSKKNPMPESVTDRPTKSHEYVFLLSKSARYYFDQDAVREPLVVPFEDQARKFGSLDPNRKGCHNKMKGKIKYQSFANPNGRNIRSVWEIATQPYSEAHFATFPKKLVEPCVKAGCPENGIVLDPFAGSGTVALVANNLNRKAILIELKEEYCKMALNRCQQKVLI